MERTWDLIQWLVDEFGYTSYLEIGCRDDATFGVIQCARKVGVDPDKGGTERMTSDDYFAANDERFDVIFIDGLHERAQALRDFENALKRINPGGTILFHDCDPPSEERQRVPRDGVRGWCGDVWKAYVEVRTRPDVDAACTTFDMGMGVVRVRDNGAIIALTKPAAELGWNDLQANRKEWLRIMETQDLLLWIKS